MGSLVSSTAVQLPQVPFYNLSNLRPGAVVICSFLRHSIMMFSKAVITLLATGALWVNVLAIPIPATMHIRAVENPFRAQPAKPVLTPRPGSSLSSMSPLSLSPPSLSLPDLSPNLHSNHPPAPAPVPSAPHLPQPPYSHPSPGLHSNNPTTTTSPRPNEESRGTGTNGSGGGGQ